MLVLDPKGPYPLGDFGVISDSIGRQRQILRRGQIILSMNVETPGCFMCVGDRGPVTRSRR